MRSASPLLLALWLLSANAAACPHYALLAPRPTVESKTESIAKDGSFRPVIAEIGAAQKVAEALLRANPKMPLLAHSPYDMAASDARYGKAGSTYNPRDYISDSRLQRQLETEFMGIRAGANDTPFVLADTAATDRNNGDAWIGFMGRLSPGGERVAVRLHVRLLEASATAQKSTLGKLGVNLIYAVYHYRKQAPKFLASLRDGIDPAHLLIDRMTVEGRGLDALREVESGAPLLASGLTPYLLFTPEGEPAAPNDLRGRVRFQNFGDTGGEPLLVDVKAVPGRWTLVLSPGVEAQVPLELIRRALTTPAARPAPVQRTGEPPSDVTEYKAKRINAEDSMKGTFVQIACGQRISGRIFEAPYGRTVYQTLYFPTVEAASGRYGEMTLLRDNWTRIDRLLEAELPHVNHHKPHRKFVIAAVVDSQNVAWIVVFGQRRFEGQVNRLAYRVQLKETDPRLQHERVGVLGINALYEFIHGDRGSEGAREAVGAGLPASAFELLEMHREGPDF